DMDLCTWSKYAKKDIILKLINATSGNNNNQLRVGYMYGFTKIGFELVFYHGDFQCDLFFMYDDNNGEDLLYVGYHYYKLLAYRKAFYPKFNLCTTNNFFGHKAHVPCDVTTILRTDYGPNW